MENKIFLDTHVLIWLYAGETSRLSEKSKKVMEEADLLASPISLLEIDFLHEIKKITMKGRAVSQALRESLGLTVADDSFAHIADAATNVAWTRDPFDRLLVAHAKLKKNILVTKDEVIRKHYHRCVW